MVTLFLSALGLSGWLASHYCVTSWLGIRDLRPNCPLNMIRVRARLSALELRCRC